MVSLKFTKFWVIKGLNGNELVIDMDLLTKIPGLKDKLNDIRELSEEYTKSLEDIQENTSDHSDSCINGDEVLEIIDKSPIIIFLGFKNGLQSIPFDLPDTIVCEVEDDEVVTIRAEITNKIEECCSNTLSDIIPAADGDEEFTIRFKDQNQRPIVCKMRPIPFALKSLVLEEINEQLKAGIIRHSKSKYASPLHVVHKSDGRVRLTVVYKLIND